MTDPDPILTESDGCTCGLPAEAHRRNINMKIVNKPAVPEEAVYPEPGDWVRITHADRVSEGEFSLDKHGFDGVDFSIEGPDLGYAYLVWRRDLFEKGIARLELVDRPQRYEVTVSLTADEVSNIQESLYGNPSMFFKCGSPTRTAIGQKFLEAVCAVDTDD